MSPGAPLVCPLGASRVLTRAKLQQTKDASSGRRAAGCSLSSATPHQREFIPARGVPTLWLCPQCAQSLRVTASRAAADTASPAAMESLVWVGKGEGWGEGTLGVTAGG